MINQLFNTGRTIARVLKNMILRPFKTVYTKIKSFFSPSKLAGAVPDAAKSLPKILKGKPEKREDYFDWGSIYIAKSLVAVILILLVILPIGYIFILHPLLTSWFWVKNFVIDDSELSSYSGKVAVYYDKEYKQPQFIGRLQDGKAKEHGEEYYENGKYKYIGDFTEGAYEGEGTLYRDDGSVIYRGEFSAGRYNGIGELTDDNGDVYSGAFEKGKLNGSGTLTIDSVLYYDGLFSDGKIEGEGKIFYPDGVVHFSGIFTDGQLNGSALEYYPGGKIKYNGAFTEGQYNGNGVLYTESGRKLYSGEFDMGQYSGSGTLYDENGVKLYSGEFEDGGYSGSGTLYSPDGSVTVGSFAAGQIVGAAERTFLNGRKYEGTFSDNLMSGTGTFSDVTGKFTYTGAFLDDDFDYSEIFSAETNTIKTMMPSLSQTVDSDCFYLSDSSFGVAIRCRFATDTAPAAATEVFTLPISGVQTEILSTDDIIAPQALSVTMENSAVLPQWAAKQFGISANGVKCFSAQYSGMTVYFWVNSGNRLVLKSAKPAVNSGGTPGTGGTTPANPDSDPGNGLSSDEIASLFEELGLDPADFGSLFEN